MLQAGLKISVKRQGPPGGFSGGVTTQAETWNSRRSRLGAEPPAPVQPPAPAMFLLPAVEPALELLCWEDNTGQRVIRLATALRRQWAKTMVVTTAERHKAGRSGGFQAQRPCRRRAGDLTAPKLPMTEGQGSRWGSCSAALAARRAGAQGGAAPLRLPPAPGRLVPFRPAPGPLDSERLLAAAQRAPSLSSQVRPRCCRWPGAALRPARLAPRIQAALPVAPAAGGRQRPLNCGRPPAAGRPGFCRLPGRLGLPCAAVIRAH